MERTNLVFLVSREEEVAERELLHRDALMIAEKHRDLHGGSVQQVDRIEPQEHRSELAQEQWRDEQRRRVLPANKPVSVTAESKGYGLLTSDSNLLASTSRRSPIAATRIWSNGHSLTRSMRIINWVSSVFVALRIKVETRRKARNRTGGDGEREASAPRSWRVESRVSAGASGRGKWLQTSIKGKMTPSSSGSPSLTAP